MNRSGFTLPETVVAMSLFALAATVLCQAAINAHMGMERLERTDAGHLKIDWAREKILAITDREAIEEGGELVFPKHIRKTPRDDDDMEADAESDSPDDTIEATWEAEIFPTRVLDVHRLDITVTIESGEELGEPLLTSCFVYRPGWYEESEGRGNLVTEKEDEWERQQQARGL